MLKTHFDTFQGKTENDEAHVAKVNIFGTWKSGKQEVLGLFLFCIFINLKLLENNSSYCLQCTLAVHLH